MTYEELFRRGRDKLSEIPCGDVDAKYLLFKVTGFNTGDYILRSREEAEEAVAEEYEKLLNLRKERVPLQHILGEWDFFGYDFYTEPGALIPRPETEILVEEAIALIPFGGRILDIGVGTGCIPISIILSLNGKAFGLGVDISGEALRVAAKNRERHKISETDLVLLESDLFENVEGTFDLITSNPPYIPEGQRESLQPEVRLYDPDLALFGGDDGLDFYRRIIREAPEYLNPGGFLIFETGHDQAGKVAELMEQDFAGIRIVKDLCGIDRVVLGTKKS